MSKNQDDNGKTTTASEFRPVPPDIAQPSLMQSVAFSVQDKVDVIRNTNIIKMTAMGNTYEKWIKNPMMSSEYEKIIENTYVNAALRFEETTSSDGKPVSPCKKGSAFYTATGDATEIRALVDVAASQIKSTCNWASESHPNSPPPSDQDQDGSNPTEDKPSPYKNA